MSNKSSARFSSCLLFLVIGFLMLFNPFVSIAQHSSTSVNLEGTEWQGQSLSQANIDGSTTILYRTYTFEGQGKVSLTILISRGVGITTSGTPFGSIPYSTASTSVGTYKISGKSIHIDLPDRKIDATISGNVMKGVLTSPDPNNNQKEEWLVEKFIPGKNHLIRQGTSEQRNYDSSTSSSNKYSAPIDSPMIGTWRYQDGCTTTGFGGFTATSCNRTSTYIYSQDGNVKSIHIINLSPQTINGNWKYTAENQSSGVLEEFKDDKLVEKANIKFLGKSQLQYTITFSINPESVDKTYIWNK